MTRRLPPSLNSPTKAQCPFCFKSFTLHGSGIANHIWRSTYCHQKKQKVLLRTLLAERNTSCLPHPRSRTQILASPSPFSNDMGTLQPDSQNPFCTTSGVMETPISGEDDDLLAPESFQKQYHVQLDHESAGFVFPNNQQTLWQCLQAQEEAGKSYAPWKSQEEWELVNWLSTTQLSQSDIDKFLKLPWMHTLQYSQQHIELEDSHAGFRHRSTWLHQAFHVPTLCMTWSRPCQDPQNGNPKQ